MAKKNARGLSHHEQLRYSYLFKNIHYLSEREKAEFNYLYQKLMTQQNSQLSAKQTAQADVSFSEDFGYDEKDIDGASFPYLNDYDEYEDTNYQEGLTEQGLPVFPDDRSVPRRSKKSRQAKKWTAVKQQKMAKQSKAVNNPRKGCLKRFLVTLALVLLLIFAILLVMFFKGVTGISNPSGKSYQPAVEEYFNGQDTSDGTNILILGSDKRIAQGAEDARTDTIMVVNIGNKDKDIKMVSFMRDTLVNIPDVSETDYLNDQKLNTAFNVGEQNNHRGAELMRETLKSNYDLDVKYYMMVDFETFAEAIDALFPSGVAIDAKFGTIDGEAVKSVEVPDDLRMDDQGRVPEQTIKVGKQRMDGRTLLNYARFRKDDDGDFGRTKRQQQVMRELLRQIKNPTKLFTGSEALGKIYALTSTNVSYPYLLKAGLSSMVDGELSIAQTTIPEQGDWVDDYDVYGGQGLAIDFGKYQKELADLGFR
ncbi:LCP family protein [Streptococcus jiangjianxini]|uniref:LCP family protein n=1 Tax=Streptococcus jiangjianxini TaxID=3161189 RepID=UPI0032EABA8F